MSFPTLYINNTGNFTADGVLTSVGIDNAGNAAVGGILSVTTPLTTIAGTTSGNIHWVQSEQGTRKVFTAILVGYENNTATSQIITFPTPFLYVPFVSINTDNAGLTASITTTTLTLSSDSITVFNGVIDVIGV